MNKSRAGRPRHSFIMFFSALDALVLVIYYLVLSLLSCLGAHRFWLLVAARKIHEGEAAPAPDAWPPVLIQLPLYNEPEVAARLVEAAALLDYPDNKMHIQVLDDSDDSVTSERVAAKLAELVEARPAVHFSHIRRNSRQGFKAGALAHGMKLSDESVIVIFDADFIPPPDFLRRIVPELLAEKKTGLVQARWEHLNRRASSLCRAQAALLDGHFMREHAVRSGRGLFFNFNGTAGAWRRETIEDAGGWPGDTLTEDLDLSWHAQMRGWHFRYMPGLAAPSELPEPWGALRGQQNRWARGSIQCARKLLRPLWRSVLPLPVRLEASVPLVANLAWPLLVLLVILSFPVFLIRQSAGLGVLMWLDLALLLPASLAFFLFYYDTERELGIKRTEAAAAAILAMVLGIGLSVNNARAVLQGLWGGAGVFLRTPKTGGVKARGRRRLRGNGWLRMLELALAGYLILLGGTAIYMGVWPALPFLGMFIAGYLWSGLEG